MNFKEVKELIRVFDKSELNKLKVKEGDFEISMQKGLDSDTLVTTNQNAPVAQAPVAQPATAQSEVAQNQPSASNNSNDTINSPMVGTYYEGPSPESPAFVKPGDTVKKGQTLCILEAMKIMNEVEAEFDCKIVDVLLNNGEPVEYDMPLFAVEKL